MDQVKCCGTVLFMLTAFLTYIVTVSGLECYSCNSLGLGESHSNDACVTFDKSKIGKVPCQIPDGKVGKCQTFQGSVTVDPPILSPKTAAGTYRSCAVFDRNAVPQNGCFKATEIPSDALNTVFKITSLLGADKFVDGTTCYCSKNNCNTTSGAIPSSSLSLVNLLILLLLCITFIWSM